MLQSDSPKKEVVENGCRVLPLEARALKLFYLFYLFIDWWFFLIAKKTAHKKKY